MPTAKTTDMGRRIALAAITDPSLQPNPGPFTVLLVTDTHVFGPEFSFADEIIDEINATSYVRQVVTVIGLTTQPDGRVSEAWEPTAFGGVGGALDATIGGCYLILDSGLDATSPVVMSIPFATPQTTDGSKLTIQWHPIQVQFVPFPI